MTKTTPAAFAVALAALIGVTACGGESDADATKATAAVATDAKPDETDPETTAAPTTTEAAPTTTERATTTAPTRIPVPVPATVAPTVPQPKASEAIQTTDVFVYPVEDFFYFGAIVVNTGDRPLVDVDIDVDSFDDTGRLIDSTTDYATIYPGVPYVIHSLTQAGQPTQVQVTVNEADWSTDTSGGAVTVENVNYTAMEDLTDIGTVTGDVRSTFPTDLEGVSVTAVWKDANGVVVAVEETYVDKLLAGQVSAFDMSYLTEAKTRVPDLVVANV